MSLDKINCSDCGKELAADERPCSNCGSSRRTVLVFVFDAIRVRESLKGKVRDQMGTTKSKFYARDKISRQGKKAKEELRIDIAGNRKFHHVEEQDEKGQWTTVHHEDKPLKKKKRK